MNIKEIVESYRNYDSTVGIEELLRLKQNLSILIYQCAVHIAELEEKHKQMYADRKLQLAIDELSGEGTIAERKNKAIKSNKLLINTEAQLEGQLKAYRIKYDGMVQLSNSMASYINKL